LETCQLNQLDGSCVVVLIGKIMSHPSMVLSFSFLMTHNTQHSTRTRREKVPTICSHLPYHLPLFNFFPNWPRQQHLTLRYQPTSNQIFPMWFNLFLSFSTIAPQNKNMIKLYLSTHLILANKHCHFISSTHTMFGYTWENIREITFNKYKVTTTNFIKQLLN